LRLTDVAQLICVTPEHLSRVLTSLEQTGVIQRKNGWIIYTADTEHNAQGGDGQWI
jgi:CRP-like cAMP-binding protein